MIKRLLSFLAIIGIIIASNFSRIKENKDPIIGTWSSIKFNDSKQTNTQTTKKEWVFNKAYIGRYDSNVTNINVSTDFKWNKKGNLYTISYLGLKNKTNDTISIKESDTATLLQDSDGKVLAIRKYLGH